MADPPEAQQPWSGEALSAEQREVYDRVRRSADLDALHDLLATYGPGILDRGLPYVLVAARNRARSRHRQAAARRERPFEEMAADLPAPSLWDPYERVAEHEELLRITHALAEMDERDALVVWRNAQGSSDEAIRREWDALGLQPPSPTGAYLRKRRERARDHLRRVARTQP